MESTGGTKRSQDQAVYQTFFSFFGLRENPFRANPDPRYLFPTSSIRRALNELMNGAQSGKSLIVLTGEAGTGKTSLINQLLTTLRRQETPVSFVFNSHLDINNLFEFVLTDFGVKFDTRAESESTQPPEPMVGSALYAGQGARNHFGRSAGPIHGGAGRGSNAVEHGGWGRESGANCACGAAGPGPEAPSARASSIAAANNGSLQNYAAFSGRDLRIYPAPASSGGKPGRRCF